MAFLNFVKRREELLSNIDLDMPPEPPKMVEEEISTEEPIDEELMPLKKGKSKKLKVEAAKAEEEELPELPPLPELGEEIPPIPEEEEKLGALPESEEYGLPAPPEETLEELDLLPPIYPSKKEKKRVFSFFKKKMPAEKLPLPEIEEEITEMPSLPEVEGEKFPEIPSLPESEEGYAPSELEEEIPIPRPEEPFKPVVQKAMPEKEVELVEKPIKKQNYIAIDDFRKIQEGISSTRDILKGIDGFFLELEEVKNVGDKKYLELHNILQDAQRKIMFVDKVLFKEAG